ncbi:MAG TPA: hypothetical protein VMH39_12260, partial [Gemmatimonadaceae bacterium]|nr:hypothetical protein [Gemmatimonadaceae bacterium]
QVAHNVSATVKKAGRDTKSAVKHAASATHRNLRTLGNHTKAALKKATGITSRANHPGGLNRVARNVSGAFKAAGSQLKRGVRSGKASVHRVLKKTGRGVKSALKGGPGGPLATVDPTRDTYQKCREWN